MKLNLSMKNKSFSFYQKNRKKKLYGCSQEIIKQDKNLKLREKKIQSDCIKRENIIAF